jgi:hypothetical protein
MSIYSTGIAEYNNVMGIIETLIAVLLGLFVIGLIFHVLLWLGGMAIILAIILFVYRLVRKAKHWL